MKSYREEDIERARLFQQYVKTKREQLGFSWQQCADNYNSQVDSPTKHLTQTAFRMMETRKIDTETIRRDSCRTVSLAFNVPMSEALVAAGYLPEDDSLLMAYVLADSVTKERLREAMQRVLTGETKQ